MIKKPVKGRRKLIENRIEGSGVIESLMKRGDEITAHEQTKFKSKGKRRDLRNQVFPKG